MKAKFNLSLTGAQPRDSWELESQLKMIFCYSSRDRTHTNMKRFDMSPSHRVIESSKVLGGFSLQAEVSSLQSSVWCRIGRRKRFLCLGASIRLIKSAFNYQAGSFISLSCGFEASDLFLLAPFRPDLGNFCRRWFFLARTRRYAELRMRSDGANLN